MIDTRRRHVRLSFSSGAFRYLTNNHHLGLQTMATVVERSMSAFNDASTDQQRAQRGHVEIIDVDLLADNDQFTTTLPSQPPRPQRAPAPKRVRRLPRPVQRRPVISETISIDDSDDDIVVEGPTVGSSSQQGKQI